MPKHRVHLSRHALERYLERVLGLNIERITRKIEYAGQEAFDAGAAAVTIDGVRFPITEVGTIVTALPSKSLARKPQKELNYGHRRDKASHKRRGPDYRDDGRRESRLIHRDED